MALNNDGSVKKLTKKQQIGNLGEDIATKFLVKQGFSILDRNYWKKWGEIDIVARKEGILHFVEVKSVSCEIIDGVTHETDGYRAEDNIHYAKLRRLGRVISTYLLDRGLQHEEWVFDAAIVKLDTKRRVARVNMLEDLVL